MRNRELSKQVLKLRGLVNKSTSLNSDLEVMSHWARYLCLQGAGFVENSVRELYGDYVNTCSNEKVTNFAVSKLGLGRIRTPNAQMILTVASAFSTDWCIDLEQFLGEEGRKEAIDSLINNRHHIAHGGSSTITIARVKTYIEKAVETVEFIEAQLTK